jgi:nicotinate-nucleotide adenylyltransferase
MRLGVFGGTFNPIHYGHLRAAEEIRQKLDLDRILFVPAGTPPLKSSELASSEHRYAMAELAVASNEYFELSDMECRRPGTAYSIETATELKSLHPEDDVFFIVGVDAFLDMHLWFEPERLTGLIDFIIMSRPGYRFTDLGTAPFLVVESQRLRELDEGRLDIFKAALDSGKIAVLISVTPLEISATDIRELVMKRSSIKYLLPEKVESFIMSNGLYSG